MTFPAQTVLAHLLYPDNPVMYASGCGTRRERHPKTFDTDSPKQDVRGIPRRFKNNMKKLQFQLSRVKGAPVTDNELLSDLKRVAGFLESKMVTLKKYKELGTYDCSTIIRHFGSWNKALLLMGLSSSNEINLPDDRLFENLFTLWQHYGRQPRRSELSQMPSTISQSPYNRRFGSWTAALKAFIDYANSVELDSPRPKLSAPSINHRKVNRDPSLRLRWKVLQRDHFTCCNCGTSPAIKLGVELHVDHIVPYSKGGETVIDNLQTLCSLCNIGKSDLGGKSGRAQRT